MSAFNTPMQFYEMERRRRLAQQAANFNEAAWSGVAKSAAAGQAQTSRLAAMTGGAPNNWQPTIQPVAYQRPVASPAPAPAAPRTFQNPNQTSPVNYSVPASPAPAPIQTPTGGTDPRVELRRLLAERARYAQSLGATAARRGDTTIDGYNAAINEVRMQLAAQNRARNLGKAANVTPEQRMAQGRSLDMQLPAAMAAGNQSATEAAMQRLAMQQRYGLPTANTEAQLLSLGQEPIAPVNPNHFAQRAYMATQNGRNYAEEAAQASAAAQQMAASPSANLAGLRERGYLTKAEADRLELEQAMRTQAIADASNQADSRYDAAYAQALGMRPDTPMTPELRALAQRQLTAQVNQAEQQFAQQGVVDNPGTALIASSGVDAIQRLQANPRDASALADLEGVMAAVNAIQDPQQKEALRQMMLEAFTQAGGSLSDMAPYQPRQELGALGRWLFGTIPSEEQNRRRVEAYRNLAGQ